MVLLATCCYKPSRLLQLLSILLSSLLFLFFSCTVYILSIHMYVAPPFFGFFFRYLLVPGVVERLSNQKKAFMDLLPTLFYPRLAYSKVYVYT